MDGRFANIFIVTFARYDAQRIPQSVIAEKLDITGLDEFDIMAIG